MLPYVPKAAGGIRLKIHTIGAEKGDEAQDNTPRRKIDRIIPVKRILVKSTAVVRFLSILANFVKIWMKRSKNGEEPSRTLLVTHPKMSSKLFLGLHDSSHN